MKKDKSVKTKMRGLRVGDAVFCSCYSAQREKVYKIVGIENRRSSTSLVSVVNIFSYDDSMNLPGIYCESHCHLVTEEIVAEIEKEHREIESQIREFIKPIDTGN